MSRPPTVRVAVASRADNVALIREVLGGLDEVARLGSGLDDVKTAVSEACNNVVMHAYDGREGPLEVDLFLLEDELEAVVRDEGNGIGAHELAEATASVQMTEPVTGRGLGLAVIGALADVVELRRREPTGIEVAMRFSLPAPGRLPGPLSEPPRFDRPAWTPGAVELALAPASLGTAVLARMVCAVAARAEFSIDRLSDAQLVADALAAHVPPALAADVLTVSLRSGRRRIELELGPLRIGGAGQALADSAIGEIGGLIERLSDEVEVREDAGVEYVRLVIVDQSRG